MDSSDRGTGQEDVLFQEAQVTSPFSRWPTPLESGAWLLGKSGAGQSDRDTSAIPTRLPATTTACRFPGSWPCVWWLRLLSLRQFP